mgnify:CR=1 FL=1
MFCYCEKCANIKNISFKTNQNRQCDLCGAIMKPVPEEYLMPNGSFFKSQKAREEFITLVKEKETYVAEIGENRKELESINEKRRQEHLAETNEKMRCEQFKIICPICGSHSVQKISTIGKYTKVSVLGILGADDLGKTWKCKVCGCKF